MNPEELVGLIKESMAENTEAVGGRRMYFDVTWPALQQTDQTEVENVVENVAEVEES